jgi:hypothetical protein
MTSKILKNIYYKLIFSLAIACLIISCTGDDGRDGMPGDIYLAHTWVSIQSIWTDNPSIPDYVLNDNYYITQPGTYNYEYTDFNGALWVGYYTIYNNPGEPGEPGGSFGQDGADGADGADICFQLTLFSTGSDLWIWDCADVRSMESLTDEYQNQLELEMKKMKEANIKTTHYSKKQILDRSFIKLNDDDPGVKITHGSIGEYSFKHVSKQIK